MEHLARPDGVELSSLDEVPYMVIEEYDRGCFLTYPSRCPDFPLRLPLPLRPQAPYSSTAFFSEIFMLEVDEQALDGLLQTWLFQGLLHEFLGAEVRFESFKRDYQNDGATRVALDTTMIVPLLDSWTKSKPNISKTRADHLGDCLTFSRHLLEYHFHAVLSRNSGGDPLHPPREFRYPALPNSNLRFSLASIVELLSLSLKEIAGIAPIPCGGLWQTSRCSAMVARGWCPFEARQLSTSRMWKNLSSLYYINLLSRSPLKHRACSASECVSSTTAFEDSTSAFHLTSECSCEAEAAIAGEELRKLVGLLSKEKIPCMQLVHDTRAQAYSAIALESSGSTPYVAISHVWSDGWGNKSGNALKLCRARKLHQVLAMFQTFADGRLYRVSTGGHTLIDSALGFFLRSLPTPRLSFWLDTYGCPIQPEDVDNPSFKNAKMNAITLMGKTYKEAAFVLVLDAELMEHSYQPNIDSNNHESMARFLVSSWTKRLWTFQEGYLAERLCVQLADGAVGLDVEISRAMQNSKNRSIRTAALWADIFRAYFPIRQPRTEEHATISTSLKWVTAPLQGRSTTRASDEALCLGTIFGLDLRPMLTLDKESLEQRRMALFWDQISATKNGIPRGVVFDPGPKLDLPGYGWAPLSLLDDSSLSDYGRSDKAGWASHKGTSTRDGLEVRFPGILLGSYPHDGFEPTGVTFREMFLNTSKVFTSAEFMELNSESICYILSLDKSVPTHAQMLCQLERVRTTVSDKSIFAVIRRGEEIDHQETGLGSGLLVLVKSRDHRGIAVQPLRRVNLALRPVAEDRAGREAAMRGVQAEVRDWHRTKAANHVRLEGGGNWASAEGRSQAFAIVKEEFGKDQRWIVD